MKIALNNIMSVILTTFIYLLGGVDVALQCLLIMIILDYISGIASAIYNKNLDSKIGLKGILKKVMYLIIVCVSVIIDKIVDTNTNKTIYQNKISESDRVISDSTVSKIKDLMYSVVNGPTGTGSYYRIDGYDIIGKTGTAQVYNNKTNSYSSTIYI